MPSLLEQIGWQRERDYPTARGVSYYSPAAQVRPPGQLANSATAQRVLRGGGGGGAPQVGPRPQGFRGTGPQMGQRGGVGPFTQELMGPQPAAQMPSIQQGAPTVGAPMTGGSIADQMLARLTTQRAQQPERPSGFMGTLGTVANTVPGRAVMAGLEAWGYPLRAVAATMEELGQGIAGGDADWSEWWKNFTDPNFSMDDVIPKTGNVWADRIAGFGADVLFDPTTYMLGSGAMAGMGRAVRAKAAARIAAEGFGDDVAATVGRYGYSALDNVTRSKLRQAGHAIEDAGWRWRIPGQRTGSPIPLTGPVERTISGISSKVRGGLYKVPGMSRLAAWRTPEGLESAYMKLIAGRGDTSVAEAAGVVMYHEYHKTAANTVHARLKQSAANMFNQLSREGADLNEVRRRAQTEGGTLLNDWFDEAADMGLEYGLKFDRRKNYVSQMLDPRAAEWMLGETPQARAFRTEMSLGSKLEDITPVLMERRFVPREAPYDIMGRKLQITTGTIDEWNEQFAAAFPELDFKLMVDDPQAIVAAYLMQFPDQVGRVNAAKRLAQSRLGNTAGYQDEGALKEVIDEVATNDLNEKAGKELQAQYKAASDATKALHDETMQGVHGIQGLVGVQMRGILDEMTTISDDTRLRLGNLIIEEEKLSDQIGARRVAPDVNEERDRIADNLLIANREHMDAVESGNKVRIAQAKAKSESLSRRFNAIAEPGPPTTPRPGRIEQEFDSAVREIDVKIADLDQQMLRAHKRAVAEAKLYSEGVTITRQRRMTDINKIRQARDAYESILAARASAEMERQAIFAIKDRIMQRQWKQQLIGRAYDDPSKLSLLAGERINKPQPISPGEVRTAGGDYRIVGMEGQYSGAVATPQQVRATFQRRKEAILPQTEQMADFSARIRIAHDQVARADADLQKAMALHGPMIEEAKAALHEIENEINLLDVRVEMNRGDPQLSEYVENLRAQMNLIRQFQLPPAEETYRMVSSPVIEAQRRRDFALHELDILERQQEEAALGSAIGGTAAPSAAPTPHEMPHTPQRVGQAASQVRKDEAVMVQWRRGPEAQQVRQLESEVENIMREWRKEKAVFDVQVGYGGAFKQDSNGNIVPAGALDPRSQRMVRDRDAAFETYERAKHQVEVLEDLEMQGDDVGDDLFRARRDRDEAKTQFDSYHTDLIRERLERYTGTEVERRLKEVVARRDRMSAMEKAVDQRQSQVKKIKRKITPIEQRITKNRGILAEQAAARRHNAELARQRTANPPVPPVEQLRRNLARLNGDKVEALRRADESFIGFKPVLEQVPTVTVATPVRAVPMSDQFYVDQYFSEMMGGGLPTRPNELSIDDADALRASYRVLRDAEMYRIMTGVQDPPALQDARAVIRHIESMRDPQWTRAALATQDTINEAVGEIERIRQAQMVFIPPAKGTAQDIALRGKTNVYPAGGSHELAHRASQAWSAIEQSRAHADSLVADGALNKRQVKRIEALLKELDYNRRTYAGDLGDETNPLISPYTGKTINPVDPETGGRLGAAPSLQVAERLEQNTADAFRVADFIFRYRAFIDAGGVPSPSASAYILGQGLRQEVKVLDQQIRSVAGLLDGGLTQKWAAWETRINKHKATIAEQDTIIARIDREFAETGYMDKVAKKKAQNTKAEAQRLMGKLLENEPDTGFISDQVNAFQNFVTDAIIDVDDATSYLRNTRDLRRVIDWPSTERARLEQVVPYYTAHVEELRLSVNRRRQAINKARAEGSDTVTFTQSEIPSRVVLTIEQAQEMLPSYTKGVAEQVQAAINASKKAGRNTVEIGDFKRSKVTMSLEQAEDELVKVEATVDSGLEVVKAAQLKLDVFTGAAHVRRDRLAQQIAAVQSPDPQRIEIMQQRLQRMEEQARLQPGRQSPGDRRRMEGLRADIDLAQNPPSPEELADMISEHKMLADSIKGIEDAMNGNLEWLEAVTDSGQEFFTRLVNGERAPTREELIILKDLLGSETGEVAVQHVQAINDVLARYGTNISSEDLVDIRDSIRRQLGRTDADEEQDWAGELTAQIFGTAGSGEGMTVDRFRGEVVNFMVASAKIKHNDQLRQFAQMFDMMGLRVFTGRSKADVQKELDLLVQAAGDAPTTGQLSKIRMLQKELDAPGTGYTRKSMLQAAGYNMSRQTLDKHTLRKFILQQFSQQGFDPVEALQDRLLTLRMRRQRTRSMIRGLGLGTNEPQVPMRSFRIMHGGAQPGQVPEAVAAADAATAQVTPPSETRAEIDEAVQYSKEVAAAEPEPVEVAPPSSGKTLEELNAEMNAMLASDIPNADKVRLGEELRRQMAELENPSPAAAIEPPEPDGRVAAIEAEIAELDDELAAGPANITDLMARRADLERELEAARGAAPFSAETPPGAAAVPPPAAAAAPPPEQAAVPTPPEGPTPEQLEAARQLEAGASIADIEAGTAAPAPALTPETTERLDEIANRIAELETVRESRMLTDAEMSEQLRLEAEANRLIEGLPEEAGAVDPIVSMYGPDGVNSPEFLQHAMDRDLSPQAYEEWLRYEARKQSRPNEVLYDWENVLFHGGPRYDMVRGMRKGQGPINETIRRLSSIGIRPSGPFAKGLLPGQLRSAEQVPAAIRRARRKLAGMSYRTAEEIEGLESEAVRAASRAEQQELAAAPEGELGQAYQEQVNYLRATDVEAEAKRVADANQAEMNRIQVEQGKLAYERYQAEQAYTKKLTEANMSLGRVRSGIAAAWNDVEILDRTKNQIERALNTTPQNSASLTPLLEDLRQVNRMRRGLEGQVPSAPGSPSWTRSADENDTILVESMIDSAIDAQMKLNNAEVTEELLAERMKQFKDGALIIEPVMERIARDGWTQLASRLLTGEDAVYVTDELARALRNAKVSWKDESFWAQVEKYTAFFKTYATATPGFHVRNALSSAFMNAVAGVRTKFMGQALPMWKQFRQNPQKFWREADENTRVAFSMVFSSGAGGQFLERGVGPESNIGGKLYRKAMNNAFTRFNRRMGEWVEGPVRLGMALDSVDRGMSLLAGSARLTHYHFNYNEVSRFDRAAKRMIPFWTFMSRNIPLQVMEMWVHPRTYQHYMAFVRNFQEPGDPLTPEYWLAQGAFTMDENAEKSESPWYLAPDLPFLRVNEPVDAAMRGDWGKALLSDINPAVAAPLEAFGVHKKFYTGAPIEGYSDPSGAMNMFTPLFQVLGMTETGGKTGETLTPESWQHMIRTLLPTVGLAERLTSTTGTRAGRQGETWARALGAPVYKLTPELRQQTKRAQYAQKREKYETQVDLARS